MSRLRDIVTVVTGASSGIGRATALSLAQQGGTVVVVARRSEALERLAAECEEVGGRAQAMPADVTDAAAIEDVAAETVGAHGRLDAWVNNAAVNQYGRFEEVPLDEWRRVIEVNLMGYAHGAHAALPWMREQGSGVLVNVGSVLSRIPAPFQSAYIASKFAVAALSGALRQELEDAPRIAVCLVLPGSIDTPLFEQAANHMGRRPKAPNPTIDARRVADAVVGVIAKPRPEVAVGYSTRTGLLHNRLSRRLTEEAAAAAMGRDQFSDEPAVATDGNLFAPSDADPRIDGGWRAERSRAGGRALAATATAGAAAALAVAARARARR